MNGLHLDIEELGRLLFERIKNAGLNLCPDLGEHNLCLPALPDGLALNFKCANANSCHRCEEHRIVRIPLVLVVDLTVPEIIEDETCGNLQIWGSLNPFRSYWLTDVTVIHDWVPYPNRPYRSLNVVEAACLLAQHPYLGSVQCHEEPRAWGHGRIQVYRSPEASYIVASREGIPSYNHHTAFTTGSFDLNDLQVNPWRGPGEKAEKPPSDTKENQP